MGIDPINKISIIIRILFAVTLFQHSPLKKKGILQQHHARGRERRVS
jgi:hypothetical protein